MNVNVSVVVVHVGTMCVNVVVLVMEEKWIDVSQLVPSARASEPQRLGRPWP